MTTELTTTDLKEVVISSKIDLTKAESIAANYSPILAEVQEQMTIVKTLVKGEAAHVEKAKRVRIDLGRIASKAANQKKIDKEDLLLQTRFVDALFNTVEGAARITQGEAKDIEEHFEKMEAERKEKIRCERWALLSDYFEIEPAGLGEMQQIVFDNLLAGAKAAKEAKIEAERLAEVERLRIEAEAEAERVRIAEEQRVEQERIKAENEKLKAEAEAKEKELEAERAKAKAEQDAANEAARIEREASAALLAKEQEAARKLAAELQAKKDAEAKAERERLAKIEADKKAAELAAKAPVKEQLNKWIDGFVIGIPDGINDEVVVKVISAKFEAFKSWAKVQIDSI